MKFKAFLNNIKCKIRGEVPTNTLVKNGMKIGRRFKRMQGCTLDISHCWLISIGDYVTLAPGVRIIAHDASTKEATGYTKIGKINIGNNVFIGAGSIVLPNVNIGDNCIIGAGSIVTKDIPSNYVAAGNPAKTICKTDDYIEKNKKYMEKSYKYDESWTVRGGINDTKKKKMIEDLNGEIGYIE